MYPDILFIPVYKGGDFLPKALQSLLPVIDKFPRVVISLNSPDNKPDKDRVLALLGSSRPNVEILETPQVYSAVRHLRWAFSSHLRESSANNLMLFFHDDRIDAHRFDEFVSQSQLDANSAYFGGWRISRNGLEVEEIHLQLQSQGESPTAWFTREDLSKVHLHTYTNASGLIIPMAAMKAFIRWVPATRGARFEHMLVSHKSVRNLRTLTRPFLIVSRHDLQEGANIPLIQGLTDEIVFQLWMFLNGRRRNPRAIWHGMSQMALAMASLTRRTLFCKTK